MVLQKLKNRYVIFMILIVLTSLIFIYRLLQLQIVHGQEYHEQSEQRLHKYITMKPPRGEIFDRYGRPLATNRMGFSIQIYKTSVKDEQFNEALLNLLNIIEKEESAYIDRLPITMTPPFEFKFTDNDQYTKEQQEQNWKQKQKYDGDMTAVQVINELREKYHISEEYNPTDIRRLVGLREDMRAREFGISNPFTIATDISERTVAQLEERHAEFPGINVNMEPVRHYVNGNLAAHILGRVGIIYAEEYNKLKDEGYGMNDVLGKDGIEKIMESYLRGKVGQSRIEQNKEGKLTQVLHSTPPIPGNNVMLTIDAELQKVAENALKENIERIREEAKKEIQKNPKKRYVGEDANSGAVVAIDVNTGEILAMATYPTYNPASFNEDYAKLSQDPLKPMFNRAISGTYPPASTFKALTGIAALEENIVTPQTKIRDEGLYKFYESVGYTPRCWIYDKKYGYQTHGTINVSDALKHSCNYFFYDVGRKLAIERINDYAKKFGLGELTGIELSGENKGILAGPESKKKIYKEQWYPGETLGAAIGEMHAFTPIQMASYASTLANGGKRYKTHLVKKVKAPYDGSTKLDVAQEILSQVDIKAENREAILEGMHSVTEEGGTASSIFKDFPVTVAGKTGTAEKVGSSNNGVFIGFAPYDNPQIAVAVVIEHGKSGGNTAPVAKEIFTAYLGLDKQKGDGVFAINELIP